MRLPSSSPFQLSPTIPNTTYVTDQPVRGAVMGLFGPDAQLADATITLVVNLDYSNSLSTTVTGPGNLSVFDPTTGLWTPTGHPWATLDLLPGGGAGGIDIRGSRARCARTFGHRLDRCVGLCLAEAEVSSDFRLRVSNIAVLLSDGAAS